MRNLKEETTVLILKPDAVKRGLVGEIIRRVEMRGLKIVSLKMIWASKEQIDSHYPKDKGWMQRIGAKTISAYQKYGLDVTKELGTDDKFKIGRMVRGWLIDYMTSGPMVKMVVKGVHAVDMVRKLVGHTIPAFAEMGTIRGDFSVDSAALANREKRAIFNLVHASETPQEANHEMNFWFSPEEIYDYKRTDEEVMFLGKSD